MHDYARPLRHPAIVSAPPLRASALAMALAQRLSAGFLPRSLFAASRTRPSCGPARQRLRRPRALCWPASRGRRGPRPKEQDQAERLTLPSAPAPRWGVSSASSRTVARQRVPVRGDTLAERPAPRARRAAPRAPSNFGTLIDRYRLSLPEPARQPPTRLGVLPVPLRRYRRQQPKRQFNGGGSPVPALGRSWIGSAS